MPTKVYPSVEKALAEGDYEELSRLGKRGGQVSARRRKAKKLLLLARREWLLDGAREMAEQANEHICPVE